MLHNSKVFSLFAQQAGEKHYHPTCARCARCEQMFAEGEEMYLQGKNMFKGSYSIFFNTESRIVLLFLSDFKGLISHMHHFLSLKNKNH